eukprot:TRINITY_DN23172_c0_g1_i1.p1 TRINITY_DN23172_c0_g1~~TRINITY_DN23172_c0_g1_i1.p1  ORF type:complete len:756 (-),score=128.41 TRINITY_DN23172_c0_g1_i1:125-2392(-)
MDDRDAEIAFALSLEDDEVGSDVSHQARLSGKINDPEFAFRHSHKDAKRSKNTKRLYTAANHLVSFSLTERPKPAPQPKRSYHPATPFSKERFLQANYRFVVSDLGDYKASLTDADVAADWDLIEEICFSTETPYNCPICLEPCVAPKALKCGHVYCWSCIIHHLSSAFAHNYTGKCPICSDYTSPRDLKSVVISVGQPPRPGQSLEFVLLQRSRSSVVPTMREHWRPHLNRHPSASAPDAVFSRFAVTSDIAGILARESSELDAAARLAESSQDASLAYILTAMESLKERHEQFESAHRLRVPEAAPHAGPHHHHHHGHGHAGAHHTHHSAAPNGCSTVDPAPTGSPPTSTASPALHSPAASTAEAEAPGAAEEADETPAEVVEDPFADVADCTDQELPNANGHSVQQLDELDEESFKQGCKTPDRPAPAPAEPSARTTPVDTVNSNAVPKARRARDGTDSDPDAGATPEYFFTYQASDGQPLFLHPMDLKILLAEYGHFDRLPARFRGTILELEPHVQTEASRKRHRASVGHLPIACNFQFVEIDMRPLVSWEAMRPQFHDVQKRAQRRRRLRDQQRAERHHAATEHERRGLKTSLADTAEFPLPVLSPSPSSERSIALGSEASQDDAAPASETPRPEEGGRVAEQQSQVLTARPVQVPAASSRDASFPTLGSAGAKAHSAAHSAPHAWGRNASAPRTGASPPAHQGVSFRDAVKAAPKKEAFEIPASARMKKSAKGGTQFVLFSSGAKRSYK